MRFTNDGETVLENDADYREAYLTWVNDFISIARYAAYYGWSEETASNIIDEGRVIHEAHVDKCIERMAKI